MDQSTPPNPQAPPSQATLAATCRWSWNGKEWVQQTSCPSGQLCPRPPVPIGAGPVPDKDMDCQNPPVAAPPPIPGAE